TPSGKKLIGLPCNVEYKALSAEGKTTHGLSPILAIIDEKAQVRGPQDDFIDAITTAQGAHENPLLIVISTQAANDADLLSIW
ncbi:terminase large subunit, partial [Escherichia coli]|nr:terminase large subunit [Escherichia coli]